MQTTRRAAFSLVSAMVPLICAATAFAGSIVRMETLDHRVTPPRPGTIDVSVEGSSIRMDAVGSASEDPGSMVFRSDVNEMTAIDHSRKQFVVIDEAALQNIAGQFDDAMQQMQSALAELPPEQICQRLAQGGEEWAAGRSQEDDVTFVVIKVKA